MREKVVVPGEELGISEEYSSEENTYEDEDGTIYADSVGIARFDDDNREVRVKKNSTVRNFSPGSIVYAIVTGVRKNRVLVNILSAEKNGEKLVVNRSMAMIPIANVSTEFVRDLRNEFRIGDLIKAEVESIKPFGIRLLTNKPGLGVIKAYCSKCRHPLHLIGRELKCTNCGHTEKRKVSREFILK